MALRLNVLKRRRYDNDNICYHFIELTRCTKVNDGKIVTITYVTIIKNSHIWILAQKDFDNNDNMYTIKPSAPPAEADDEKV